MAEEVSPRCLGPLVGRTVHQLSTTLDYLLGTFLEGKHVLFQTDNTSAVFHINHQDWNRSLSEAQRLLKWAHPCLASLRVVHLTGTENSVADYLSLHMLSQGVELANSGCTDGLRFVWDSRGRPFCCTPHNPLYSVVFFGRGQCQCTFQQVLKRFSSI